MAISSNSYVYMEAVEETENKDKKSEKAGSVGRFIMASWQHSKGSLVYDPNGCGQYSINKRKTDKQWLL